MTPTVKVWDPLVRVFHWSLVISFALAWLTADDAKSLHLAVGYIAAALIAFRLVWGAFGPVRARFRDFVCGPTAVLGYVKDVIHGRERRYLGHNPLGGLMILALIVSMAGLCFSGWLYTTDAYWGAEWVEELHEALANAMLMLVALHVAGVVLSSVRHHENLVRAMITGEKRTPAGSDLR